MAAPVSLHSSIDVAWDAETTGGIVPPQASVEDITTAETGGNAIFTVRLDAANANTVKISYATADGTAKAGEDYVAKDGTLTFVPGQTSKQVSVTIINDTAVETPETFYLDLKQVSVIVPPARGRATGTISSDDTAPPVDPDPPAGDFVWNGLQTAWPNAGNTGPRVPITATRGDGSVSGTIKATRFTGTAVPSDGAVFEDCVFESGGNNWAIDGDNKRFTVRNCRFVGKGGSAAILGNADIFACDISGYYDGIKPQGDGWIIRGNYLHDPWAQGADPHNDGIQASAPHKNALIEQNYIKWRDTSAVMFGTDYGTNRDCVVRHNWLGGADLPLRMNFVSGGQAYENVIQRGHWGYSSYDGDVQSYGNIDAVTGSTING